MIGVLAQSGVGSPIEQTEEPEVKSISNIFARAEFSNAALLKQLREDEHSHELLSMTKDDAALGRMSAPVPISNTSANEILLCPRFAVPQWRADGSLKLRAVDHFSWSDHHGGGRAAMKQNSVNGHAMPTEKYAHRYFFWVDFLLVRCFAARLKHEALDELGAAMKLFQRATSSPPGLWKADVDAAYRRIPVKAEHRSACGVAFKVGSQVRTSCFGFHAG